MDEFNNLIDTGRFLRVMADIETGKDEPEPHQFKRDQHLTPVEQFRGKVLEEIDFRSQCLRNEGAIGAAFALDLLAIKVQGL